MGVLSLVLKSVSKGEKNVLKNGKNVSKAENVTKVSEKNVLKNGKNVSKAEKLSSKVKKELIKGFVKGAVKDAFKDRLFSPDVDDTQEEQETLDNSFQKTSSLARNVAKTRSDKRGTHWRKDGDIVKASKYRYTIDLDKAIEQDKKLKNINERVDSALYAISGNIPNIKTGKKAPEEKDLNKDGNPASEQSILGLTKSIDLLNDNLRKSKQTVTEETAQKLLVSNSKIEILVKKISDDMIDEQDTSIKPIERASEVQVPEIVPENTRASKVSIIQRAQDSSFLKTAFALGLTYLGTKLLDFIVDNFIKDGHFTFDIIKDKLENWFSEKYQSVKDWVTEKYDSITNWFSETFDFDNIINSVKDWFTSDPVSAIGTGFLTAFAGAMGFKLGADAWTNLRSANKVADANKKLNDKEIQKTSEKNKVKTTENTPKSKLASATTKVPKSKLAKALKAVPGLGLIFTVFDLINAGCAFYAGNTKQAEQYLIEAGVDAIEAIPVIGTAIWAGDLLTTFFTGNSLAEHIGNAFNNREPEKTAMEELHNSNVIEESGWFGKDQIKDKQALEMYSADYISELIDEGDWSDDDLKYLQDLYNKKSNESDADFKKRRADVTKQIKDIGKRYHEDADALLKECSLHPEYAQVLKDAEQSNDKVGYSTVIKERTSPAFADIYRRMQLALKTAFALGASVNLEKDEVEKLLKIGKYDNKYLDENQEVLLVSEENSPEFKNALDKIIETEQSHLSDADDYDKQVRTEMMNNPNLFHEQGGARSEFDTSGKPKDLGGPVENYQGNFKTVGGDALQVSDEIKGIYAQKYPKIRGIRNNNPGNIRLTNIQWEGKIPREKNTDRVFEQFCAPEFGIRALAMNAKNYQVKGNLWTPRAMIWKWAPPNENNSDKYVADVVKIFHQSSYEKAKNITADTSFTMTDPEMAYCMVCGIILKENGVNPYPENLIKRAINSALGKESLMTKTQSDVVMSKDSGMQNSVAMPSFENADNVSDDGSGADNAENVKSNNFSVMQSSSQMPSSPSGIAGDFLNTATSMASSASGYSKSNRMSDSQYDCSSFVSRTVQKCGFNMNPSTTTFEMRNALTDLGFTYTPVNDIQGDYSMLRPGDILLNDRNQGDNHTEFYMGDGWSVGAHSTKNGVSARPNNIDVYHYNGFLRYNGENPDDNHDLQNMTNPSNSFVNPVKDTTVSDREVMQTSENITNAVNNVQSPQSINVSNNTMNVENQQEMQFDDSSQHMFDANIVNTDFVSEQFAFNPNLGYN